MLVMLLAWLALASVRGGILFVHLFCILKWADGLINKTFES